jgi:hypothetical protein
VWKLDPHTPRKKNLTVQYKVQDVPALSRIKVTMQERQMSRRTQGFPRVLIALMAVVGPIVLPAIGTPSNALSARLFPSSGRSLPDNSATKTPTRLSLDADLDSGLFLLYDLKFSDARQHFALWEQQHPADSLGPSLEAAADLFQEYYSEGMLTSEFFGDDKQMFGGLPRKPDHELEAGFYDAARRSEQRAHWVLDSNPRDPNALFALTLDSGMLANHYSLIEKRQIEGLRQLREADRNAHQLLEVAPDTDDAYLALGVANYIIGCLPGYKRAVLRLGGVHGDKTLGMRQLALVATQGRYLRPYAKLLLALAAMRENQAPLAREELTQLSQEFPGNPLYARELTKLPQPSTTLCCSK